MRIKKFNFCLLKNYKDKKVFPPSRYRSRTYLFDELLQKWMEKLKAAQQTHMGVRLLKEIDSFRVSDAAAAHSRTICSFDLYFLRNSAAV